MIVNDLRPEHIEKRIRIGEIEGNLGMLHHLQPEVDAVIVALWDNDHCHQHSWPADTPCEVLG